MKNLNYLAIRPSSWPISLLNVPLKLHLFYVWSQPTYHLQTLAPCPVRYVT